MDQLIHLASSDFPHLVHWEEQERGVSNFKLCDDVVSLQSHHAGALQGILYHLWELVYVHLSIRASAARDGSYGGWGRLLLPIALADATFWALPIFPGMRSTLRAAPTLRLTCIWGFGLERRYFASLSVSEQQDLKQVTGSLIISSDETWAAAVPPSGPVYHVRGVYWVINKAIIWWLLVCIYTSSSWSSKGWKARNTWRLGAASAPVRGLKHLGQEFTPYLSTLSCGQ